MANSGWTTENSIAAAIWVVAFAALVIFLFWANKQQQYGFIPWEGAPRLEFASEGKCWTFLAQAKDSNPYLRSAKCTLPERK